MGTVWFWAWVGVGEQIKHKTTISENKETLLILFIFGWTNERNEILCPHSHTPAVVRAKKNALIWNIFQTTSTCNKHLHNLRCKTSWRGFLKPRIPASWSRTRSVSNPQQTKARAEKLEYQYRYPMSDSENEVCISEGRKCCGAEDSVCETGFF